jgi:hypothetical protein
MSVSINTPSVSRDAPSKSILKDINDLAIPEDIKTISNRIFI